MRVIILEEDRFTEIVEILKLQSEKLISATDNADRREGMKQAHKSFHYYLVQWAQSHGASCIR